MKLDKKTITWIILVVLAGLVALAAVIKGAVESGNQADPSPENQLSVSIGAKNFKADYAKVQENNRFLPVAKTREGALALLNLVVDQDNSEQAEL